jgi:hypothetical protein
VQSPVTEHVFPSIKILTTNGTGDRDPETRILYLRHWNTIRTEEVTGNRVQDRYNFALHDMTASTFPVMVRRIFFVFQNMVWKNDSGTNRVVKQLVDIKRHIGQEVHNPFGVRTLLSDIRFMSTSCLTTRLVPESSFQTIF